MRFQTDRRPSLLSRRDQFRLLFMMATLVFMLFAVQWAAQPDSWRWLFPQPAEKNGSELELRELDFRVLDADSHSLAPDTFRAVNPSADRESLPPEGEDAGGLNTLQVPAHILKPIEDNVLGVRRSEAEAYAFLLNLVDELPDDVVEAQARRDASFTVLMLHPEEFRGQLVSLEGELRRLERLTSQPPPGIEAVYEGWLFTRDSGTNPYRIVFTQHPPGAPLAERLDPPLPVRVTGYFFKRYGYVSQGGQHVAPMLIARSIQRLQPAEGGIAQGPQLQYVMLTWIVGILVCTAMVVTWFMASDRRYRNSRLKSLASSHWTADPRDLAALRDVPTVNSDHPFEVVQTTGSNEADE